ncbi:membrane-associated protein [Acuticoccus sediminis]|uniref:Membrane-associated protein n=1 Tax=Acuticoccus sediminis TaxID=2184697 RepID=A0A8B2NJK6_9HYPH|nr:VTT domain-containing protein [Acuticoccus sediminis]RAH96107.1 membrane-associated protein [Acuticoccus sediminis]
MEFDPLGAGMSLVSGHGLAGVFALALAERIVPIIPSYGLLLALGIMAADGAFGLPAAVTAATLGSVTGCAAVFCGVGRLGEARSTRLVMRCGRSCGLSAERIDRGIEAVRRRQTILAFALQLVPTVRLFAPAFAALVGARPRGVLAASALGIAVWNAMFIAIGFGAARWGEPTNMTTLTLAALGALLAVEGGLFWTLRKIRTGRGRPDASSAPC